MTGVTAVSLAGSALLLALVAYAAATQHRHQRRITPDADYNHGERS